jgi:hypothetical protein
MPAVAAKRTRKIIRSPKPPKPPGTELAIVSRGIERAGAKALMTKPTPADKRRWFLVEGNQKTVEQVAVEEGVSSLVVQTSIDRIRSWMFRNQLPVLTVSMVETILGQLEGMNKVFQQGMKAEKVIFVDKETGKVTKTPDTAMRLKTITEIRGLMETVQPRTPLVQTNQQFINGVSGGGNGYGPSMSFEAILRKKRGEVGLANEQEIAEAEIVTAEDELSNEFKDFGGDEDDGEEDEDEDESSS